MVQQQMTTKSQWPTAMKTYFSFMSIVDYLHGLYLRTQADKAVSAWNITDLTASKKTKQNQKQNIAEHELTLKTLCFEVINVTSAHILLAESDIGG